MFLGHSVGVPLELCPSSKANKVGLKIFTLRENQGKSQTPGRINLRKMRIVLLVTHKAFRARILNEYSLIKKSENKCCL